MLVFSLLYSCDIGNDKNTETSDSESSVSLSAADFFPITENVKYTYSGEGNEYIPYTVYIEYASDSRVQQRIDNGATVVAKVIELKDGKATEVFRRAESYARENYLDRSDASDGDVLLAEPIKVGNSWKLSDGSTRTITNTAAEVITPSGTYTAVEVTTSGNSSVIQYYAKNVGLVKTVYPTDDGTEIYSELASVDDDVSYDLTLRFYYPDAESESVFYIDKTLALRTNDVISDLLASVYKDVPDRLNKVFSDNTLIDSLYIGDDGIVRLDLSSEFMAEMNAGSGYEALILRCATDTFCGYYGASQLILTVGGKPYSSGHFAFAEDEAITADYTGVAEYK
jgi:Sporulation and spore germination.